MTIKWRPQIIVAMVLIALIACLVIWLAPDHIELIAGGAVTGIGMLGIKLLENE